MKKNTLIEVEWDDIITDSAWIAEEKAIKKSAVKCKSMGYFLNKDKKVLRLSHTIQLCDKPERDLTIIPLGCVMKIRKLKHQGSA